MGLAVGLSMWIAWRTRPTFRGMTPEQASLERYRVALEPYRRRLTLLISIGLGFVTGLTAAAEWGTYLLWRNSTPFGIDRPAVRPRPVVLHVRAAVLPLPHRLRLRRHLPEPPVGRRGAVPVRRPAPAAQGRPRDHGGAGAAEPAHRPVHPAEGGVVLVRPVRPVDAEPAARRRLHRPEVHRRLRGAAGAQHPRCHLGAGRRALPRQRLPPPLGHPGPRRGPAGPHERRRRHPVPADRPAVPGAAQRARPRAALHRAQHQRHARRVRHRRQRDHRVPGHGGAADGGGAQRERGHAQRDPAARPRRRLADVQPAAADPRLLLVQQQARRRPVRPGRQKARRHRCGARDQPRRHPRRPAQLDERPDRVHARLRPGRGLRQHGPVERAAGLLRERDPGRRRARRPAAARVLRRAEPGLQHRRRARGHPAGRARLPRRRQPDGTGDQHLHRHRRRPDGLAARASAVRDQVPGHQHPAVRPGQLGVAHPVGSRSADPRREGRPVADPRPGSVPHRGRRAHQVGRRRLHAVERVPLQQPRLAERRDERLRQPADAAQHPAAARPGQLRAQLGQGRRRRLRRHGDPVRLGPHRSGAA